MIWYRNPDVGGAGGGGVLGSIVLDDTTPLAPFSIPLASPITPVYALIDGFAGTTVTLGAPQGVSPGQFPTVSGALSCLNAAGTQTVDFIVTGFIPGFIVCAATANTMTPGNSGIVQVVAYP